MNQRGAWGAPLIVGAAVAMVAGCSGTDRKVPGTATAPVGASPTTSTRPADGFVDPAKVSSLLVLPEEVAGIVGVGMTPGRIFKQPFSNLSTEPARCVDAVMPGQHSTVYNMPAGFAAQILDGAAPHVRTMQVVAAFASTDDAASSYAIASGRWSTCQDKVVTLTADNVVATQKTGRVETRDSITSIPVTPSDENIGVSCQHAFTAKRNVVIDVRVCASNVGDMGRQLVSKIATKLN